MRPSQAGLDEQPSSGGRVVQPLSGGSPDVLVVGAGPTGLTLATQLAAHGARVRIVERRPNLVRESRAVVIHPRTLEMLRPLGVADELVRKGDPNAALEVHFAGRRPDQRGRSVAGRLAGLGLDDTSYPFLLVIPQVETETVLSERLRDRGVTVERGVELVALAQDEMGPDCTLLRPSGELERVTPRYVVGCDGVNSTVRRHSAITFGGSFYPYPLVLADLEVERGLVSGAAHAFVAKPGILFFFPIGRPATWRMLAARPPDSEGSESLSQLQDIANRFAAGRVVLREPVWQTELWLQRRLSGQYRDGRVFLAGDAAHVHSPAMAQGMNAGIRDACNLGWKLALVSRGLAVERLLDSYEAEHRPLAKLLRAVTDLAFAVETGDHLIARVIRSQLAPWVVPLGLRSGLAMSLLARGVGGMWFRYRGSPAVGVGNGPGGLRLVGRGPVPGDRLPDVQVTQNDQPVWLHEVVAGPGFQLLLCGPLDRTVADRANRLVRRHPGLVRLHWLIRESEGTAASQLQGLQLIPLEANSALVDSTGRASARLGLRRPGYLLVRPDGYVAARGADRSLRAAAGYLATWLR